MPDEVDAVGHRVVHGGRVFGEAALIDAEVIEQIGELASLAPLHTEPALRGIRTAQAALPDVPHVAVFDSAFHRTHPGRGVRPTRSRAAGARSGGSRRYGFHGLAVASVADRMQVARLVVCHLGGGLLGDGGARRPLGRHDDGLQPARGRPDGDALRFDRSRRHLLPAAGAGLTPDELDHTLKHESGLAALGGLDDPLGFAVYTYRVAQAVAAMATALGGIDTLAFSGGVGENRSDVREAVAERLRFLGEFTVEAVPAREDVIVARHVRALLDQ